MIHVTVTLLGCRATSDAVTHPPFHGTWTGNEVQLVMSPSSSILKSTCQSTPGISGVSIPCEFVLCCPTASAPDHRWEQGWVLLAQTSPCQHWVWAGGLCSGLHWVCHNPVFDAVKRDLFLMEIQEKN